MASRAERRRAAAVLFLFAVLHRSTALDHAAADARAGARKLLGQGGAVGHTAGGERASPARTPSRPAQGNAFDSLTMTFVEELAVVATETTVPRGRVCSAVRQARLLLRRAAPVARTSARWRPQSWGHARW